MGAEASIVTWETLESFVRVKVQAFVRDLLEEEVTTLLRRGKSVRRQRWTQRLATATATASRGGSRCRAARLRVERPRVRGLEERFESRVLPLFERWTKEVGEVLPSST